MVSVGNYKIILASNSPRRQELLTGLGIEYTLKIMPDIDESYPQTLKSEEIPLYIARKKADAYKAIIQPDELVITADTIVWLDEEMLGKPNNESEAIQMLGKLSGKTHQVITGVYLTTAVWQRSFSSVTEVAFATLTPEEIDYYVKNYHPFDKAGSYGVQEWIGFVGVKSISGSYYNVMGLPIQRLYRELKTIYQ
ncbi:Septum formation protein Maf [termite gut metagenome]|uniref:Septum formation protein Maf n=1 Tax=termite gut metagenome TaxID=433724 RepID=A0A5J4SAN9_9ZZZZ